MAIIVQDISDADIAQVCEFEPLAFSSDPISPIIFPGPFPADSGAQRVAQLIEGRNSDPSINYMSAVDEESGKIVAFAKWHIYDTPEAAACSARPSRSFGPGSNPAACEAFFGGMGKKKAEVMGLKPHLYLHMLFTNPSFQGRGAGSLLLQWGTKKADELGLPAYLEASPAGIRLYQRHGFEKVASSTIDASQFGGQGLIETPLMIRQPVKSS